MIIAVLLVVALAAAIAAWLTGGVAFAWVALALSVLVLVVLVARRLWERTSSDAAEAPSDQDETGDAVPETAPEPVSESVPAPKPARKPAATESTRKPVAATPSGADGVEVVYVQPGRRRFHRQGCELIADRETDDIALEDARDEGFSACTVCYGVAARR